MPFNLKQNLPAIALFVFFLSLYIYTAAPGVYDGDSGEIAAAVNQLGLAHPTGFPLYMLSGKLLTLLVPIRDIAYRLNIFSSILTASALVFFYYTLKNLGNSSFASLAASFILGFGRNTIWSNAGTARVYALSLLFASILFFIFSKWRKKQKTKYLYWYGFTWGLSLGTHALMLTMAVPFIYMLWQARRVIKERISILAKTILLTLIPAIQYLYLFFAYKRNAIVNWGDLSSWDGFVYYITQRQYATKIFANTLSDMWNFLVKISGLLTSEFTIIFFAVAAMGLVGLFKKNGAPRAKPVVHSDHNQSMAALSEGRNPTPESPTHPWVEPVAFWGGGKNLSVIFILIFLVNAGLMYGYGKSDDLIILFRYVFIADLVLALVIAHGLDMAMNWVRTPKSHRGTAFFAAITVAVILFQFKFSYAYNDRRNNYIFEDFARNILVSVESDSILLTTNDSVTNPIWYFQSAGQGKDIAHLSADLTVYNWYMANEIKRHPDVLDASILAERQNYSRILSIIDKNIKKRKIYATFTAWDKYSETTFDFVPVGNIYAIIPKGSADKLKILQKNQTLWDRYVLRDIRPDARKDFMANQLIQHYARSLNNIGVVYANLNLPKESVYFLQKSIDIIPAAKTKENLKQVEKNLTR